MAISQKCPLLQRARGRNFLICLPGSESLACLRQLWRLWHPARPLLPGLIFAGILVGFLPIFEQRGQEIDLGLVSEDLNKLTTIEENSLLPIADFSISNPKLRPAQKIRVVVTAYSSTPWETDEDPRITAAGTKVREGIVASNLLAFGTKIRIPEIFGNKVFVVEDRMSWKKGNYHFDVWFPYYWQALNFGVKRTYVEILD